MHFSKLITAVIGASSAFAAAPLVPTDGKVLLGAWYDRNNSDTPSAVNARIGYKPLAFFQTDVDFSGTIKPWTSPQAVIPQFLQQLQETGTNASAMLTVYPFQGFDGITDAQLADMADRLNTFVKAGRPVYFRFASEMNGSWFQYGQDPIGFVAAWRRCITYWRKALGANADKVAFIWSPNSGNGYPYPGQPYSINTTGTDAKTLANLKVLDTNGDGKVDGKDDPYTPYYPGDEYVDWVGMSIYHYGVEWPWVDNNIPETDKFEKYLNAFPAKGDYFGYAPFYTYFSSPEGVKNAAGAVVSAGNKPLFISETAATYHFAYVDPAKSGTPGVNPPASRLDIKQAWWRSFLNKGFLSKYPNIHAISTFEFVKDEELTWRDFTMFGAAPNPKAGTNFSAEANSVASAFAVDAKSFDFLTWAGASSGTAQVSPTKSSGAVQTGAGVVAAGVAALAFLL
ncbi:UNVERIFIED_CONTAM: hypothetical protein HDU68_009651 [Siphonaria sp. JEL0065]|nr:hypothetical protein HDU68_009651 [Siphonaria sp. JEL0065]